MRFFSLIVRYVLPLLLLTGLLVGCDSSTTMEEVDQDVILDVSAVSDPAGVAPLTALVTIETSEPVQVGIEVPGRTSEMTVRFRTETLATEQEVPVLGLYPASVNEVVVTAYDAQDREVGQRVLRLATGPLLEDLPQIEVTSHDPAAARPGMNLVSYFGHNGEFRPQRPFFFDATGNIRWYLDLSSHPTLSTLFYDNGMERLANGNLYFGDGSTDRIYEMDMLGRIVESWEMPGYTFHHNVIELPNGNFVVTVNKNGVPTVEDYLIEIDRTTGAILNEWDLNQSLDNTRRAWPTDLADLNVDWFHANAVTYDSSDDTIIVSGRTQGIVKLTWDNEVVWILAPHRDWVTAGNGTDLQTKLLQPLDASGTPITDADVLDGSANHPDFEWSWYQHAPALMPDGSLLLFDNGDNRNYTNAGPYSRAVVYAIDEEAMTIQQRWQYGKELGASGYSRIVSDADYHEAEDAIVFMPGAIGQDGPSRGRMVEVDRTTRAVAFDATLTPPIAPFNISFHRIERLPLYPLAP